MTSYETMTLAGLVTAILGTSVPFDDPYRAEFARRVQAHRWPGGDPVQAVLGRIRQQDPAGDMALLLAVADLAAKEHAPAVWPGRGAAEAECGTCLDGTTEPGPAPWPCDSYLKILVALDGVPHPVRGELVHGELPPAS